jgi:hypothetical protein
MFFTRIVTQFKVSSQEEDFKFLNVLISNSISNFKKTIELDGTKFAIEDNFIQLTTSEIVSEVYSNLSENYKELLYLYLNGEKRRSVKLG